MEPTAMSVIQGMPPALADVSAPRVAAEFTLKLTPFDQRRYRKLIAARAKTIRRVARRLKPAMGLATALDAGCGVGFFTQTLAECGLRVRGFDGREENIVEARKRFPRLPFETADIEERGILRLGRFDFVLCCGLMYHLENPLLAMRKLRALTEKCLLLESMCIPDEKPSMLLREEPRTDDQGRTWPAEISAPCVHTPEYGTRSAMTVVVPASGRPHVRVADGPPCESPFLDVSGLWTERGSAEMAG